jgi:hypothetical protein
MKIIGFVVLVALVAISGFLYKRVAKAKLSESLGRDVADHEIDSIATWLEATPEKQKTYKKYVPAANSKDER